MKNNYNRDWLETYKTNPKTDNTIYKNYQNPSMTKWDTQMAGLSPAQKGRYEQFINTIPDEVKGLSAAQMQTYLQGANEKQQVLAKERASYDTQVQRIKAQQAQQAQARRQAEAEENQARIRAMHERDRIAEQERERKRAELQKRSAESNAKWDAAKAAQRSTSTAGAGGLHLPTAYVITPSQFAQGFTNPSYYAQVGTPFQHSGTHPTYAGPYNIAGSSAKYYINQRG